MAEIGVRNIIISIRHSVFVILFFIVCECVAQNSTQTEIPRFHGLPPVIHYSKKDFKGDPQFWAMCQDKNGVLYFANNDGALVFDGQTWQKVLLPNKSSIRSIMVSRDNTVYAGGFNEFGVIRKDAVGKYYYESLMPLLRAEERNIENIWQIHEVQGHIVFRSFKKLIAVSNNKAVTFSTSSDFLVAGVVDNRYFVQDQEGLRWLDLKSMAFDVIADLQKFNREEPVSIIAGFQKGEVLVITKQGSFFIIDPLAKKISLTQRFFGPGSNNLFTTAVKTSSGDYYIGTLRTKVIALSASDRKVTEAQAFNSLQDNTVHNLFESRDGKIWTLLNNGIDCIDVKSPVSLMLDDASVYDVVVDNRKLFIATNQGVFVSDDRSATNILTKQNFRNIGGLEGQAWSLGRFENQILCSHDKGIFVIDENSNKKIPGLDGVWKVISIKGKPHQYLACAYDGLYLLNYRSGSFQIAHKLEGFNESSRDIVQADEPGIFWICHGYKGVFRIKIDEGLKRVVGLEHFKDQNGLPSPFNNNVAKWNGQIVFTTNHGIFSYNEESNKFVQHAELTKLFGKELNVRKLIQHQEKTWFVHDNELGYFMNDSQPVALQKDLFLQLKGTFNPSMECIIPISENNVLIGTNNGLYAFDLDYEVGNEEISTLLTGVTYQESSSGNKIALNIAPVGKVEMPRKSNYISFNYSTPGFRNKSNVQFSYFLEGLDQSWSEWSEIAGKEYSSLGPGKYVFRVRSRSLLGEKGSEVSYAFAILPAWYQAPIALAGFAMVGIIIIGMVVVAVRRRIRHERHKTLAEEKEKRRLLELEIERIKLASEKAKILKDKELLEEDVIYKSKELVNYTMLLVKKRELLSEMHEQLRGLKEIVKNDPSRQAVNDLIKKINLNLDSDEYIRVFEANFERVHQEFFNQLKATFPDLTPKELQLCAFVRMNLTNKEIAAILNLSVRGIETARYRLRKRLGMTQEQDMSQFLDKLHSSSTDHNPEVATLTI
jgi:AraC family transcriptional regulator, chitin signaling transcriptional activator